MKSIFTLLLLFIMSFGISTRAQDCSIVLNHFYVTVDSATYQGILDSKIMNSNFAYAYEKNKNWQGIYLIGKDNYIEIFHPNSIQNEELPLGYTWICHSSLKANCIEKLEFSDKGQIAYYPGEEFDELTYETEDSVNLFSVYEMNKSFYESWTKKPYHDSLQFETTDYNSPAESDSSQNYLFKNVMGLHIDINPKDSASVVTYLNLIGYRLNIAQSNSLRFISNRDFITVNFSKDVQYPSISTIYFTLNKKSALKQIKAGSSLITLKGTTGKWEFNTVNKTEVELR